MTLEQFWKKVHRRLLKIRLRPIRVLCFHQVSDVYEPLYGGVENWTQTEQFKRNILVLKSKYSFISLYDALGHLRHDIFRLKRYAVLTCDDGYQNVVGVLPWLEQQGVPITLFISVKYLDGVSYDSWFDSCWEGIGLEKKNVLLQNMYLHWSHLKDPNLFTNNVNVALHGIGHDDVSIMNESEFSKYVDKGVLSLGCHTRFIPFFAYTWGRHSAMNDKVLLDKGIIPVCCDGMDNYKYEGLIHRVWIDGRRLELLR